MVCPSWHYSVTAKDIDLGLFVSCFPASFDLLISFGQKGLIMYLLKSGPTFSKRPSGSSRTLNKIASKSGLKSLNIEKNF